MNAIDELKPCPFCGDEGEKGSQVVHMMTGEQPTFNRIICRVCGAMCPQQNWNNRAAATEGAAPAAPLDSALWSAYAEGRSDEREQALEEAAPLRRLIADFDNPDVQVALHVHPAAPLRPFGIEFDPEDQRS